MVREVAGRSHFRSLKTLTSSNKEVRPFFLSDNSIWSLPSALPLAVTAFRGPEGYFSLAIIAFGAFNPLSPNTSIGWEKWTKGV